MAGENTMAARRPDSARRIAVLLPLPLSGAYDYALPAEMTVAPGDFLRVPLGRREVIGVAWGEATGEVSAEKLKPVARRLALPPIPDSARRFIDWVAHYTVAPPGAVLRMARSVRQAREPPRPLVGYRRGESPESLGM